MSHRTIVFICEHGAAKSVIAAAYLPQLARAQGMTLRALARGTDPEPAVSAAAAVGLRAAGLPVPDHPPCRPASNELASATAVVSFGANVDDSVPDDVPRWHWHDIPAVSDGFDAARDAIVARLLDLLADIDRATRSPEEAL